MRQLRTTKTNRDLVAGTPFDVGRVIIVNQSPLVSSDGARKQSIENYNRPNGTYTVELESSQGIISNVHSFGVGVDGQADMTIYPPDTRVLIGYFGDRGLPFILCPIAHSRIDSERGTLGKGIEHPMVQSGEYYKSSTGRASVYLRKDGGAFITGSIKDEKGPNADANYFVNVGGDQGMNEITDNTNVITIGTYDLGPIISIDEKGGVAFISSESHEVCGNKTSEIENDKTVRIGQFTEDSDDRYGSKTEVIGKTVSQIIGTEKSVSVGNTKAKDSAHGEIKEHAGKDMKLFGRETVNIDNVELDGSGNEKSVGGKILLGDKSKATENVVLGQQWMAMFESFLKLFTVTGASFLGVGNLGAPVPTNPAIITKIKTVIQPQLVKLLSEKTFTEEKDKKFGG